MDLGAEEVGRSARLQATGRACGTVPLHWGCLTREPGLLGGGLLWGLWFARGVFCDPVTEAWPDQPGKGNGARWGWGNVWELSPCPGVPWRGALFLPASLLFQRPQMARGCPGLGSEVELTRRPVGRPWGLLRRPPSLASVCRPATGLWAPGQWGADGGRGGRVLPGAGGRRRELRQPPRPEPAGPGCRGPRA